MHNRLKLARPASVALGLMALLGTVPAFAADAVMEAPPAPAIPMEEPRNGPSKTMRICAICWSTNSVCLLTIPP